MEVKEEKVNDPIQETGEASGYVKLEEYPSSGESTITCSTLSSLVSVPPLESLSDESVQDFQQPHAEPEKCPAKPKRRKRGRKPKQPPKTASEEFITENVKESVPKIKVLLPKKVGSSMKDPNTADSECSYAESHFIDDGEAARSLEKLNITKGKKKRKNKGKYTKRNVMSPPVSTNNPVDETDSDKFPPMDPNKVSGKESSSNESEIAFEKQVSELCQDIQKTSLGNRKGVKGKAIRMPSSPGKFELMDCGPPSTSSGKSVSHGFESPSTSQGNADAMTSIHMPSGSDVDYALTECSGPSTSYDKSPTQIMKGKLAIAEKRKKIFKKRKETLGPRSFEVHAKKKMTKLIDEIDQIDAILAREIEKKDDYYQKGYKITHQILTNLQKEKEDKH